MIVYDAEGYIILQSTGLMREPVGVPVLMVYIPQGQRVTSIDVTNEIHVPIFEDLPKTEVQLLQEQVDSLNIAIAEILGV